MASLYRTRETQDLTVNVTHPEPIEKLRTVANQQAMDEEIGLTDDELEKLKYLVQHIGVLYDAYQQALDAARQSRTRSRFGLTDDELEDYYR
jgi:hypothetical protein